MKHRSRVRPQGLAGAAILAVFAALMLPAGSAVGGAAAGSCGLTTLDASVVARADGTLACGPGRALTVRTDLQKPQATRVATRSPLLSFLTLADMSIPDEESPLRAEFADACGTAQSAGFFRPQETLIPALVNATVKAADALASNPTGSPETHSNYSFAVQLGNAADNQQYDEVRTAIDLLDGGKVVNPNSGSAAYQGAQATDPAGGTPALNSPVAGSSLRDLGNAPFYAPGLRAAGGAPLPWYGVIGNHDVRGGGWMPSDNAAWQTFANAFATGQVKLSALGPERVQRVCANPALLSDPSFWTQVAAAPGVATVVTADANRRLLDRADWISEHSHTTGLPTGHGFGGERCTDATGATLARACYTWTQAPVRFIALDTTPSTGTGEGDIDPAQFAWLERTLVASSSHYLSATGAKTTTKNADELVVVFSQHSTTSLDNTEVPPGSADTGADLQKLLLRFPNVILQVDGDNAHPGVIAHRDAVNKTQYWEVSSTSVAEWPAQSRSIEIADNHDGTLSIFGVLFDAAAPPNARGLHWSDDATRETTMGTHANVNEDWLASAAREIALHDPQHPAEVAAKDRNVELVLRNPWGITKAPFTVPPLNLPPTFKPPTFPTGGFAGFPKFPTGFPGGLPYPQRQFGQAPTPPFPQQSFYQGTERGLAVKPTGGDGAYSTRVILLLLAAAGGASWLARARVRRWMVGI